MTQIEPGGGIGRRASVLLPVLLAAAVYLASTAGRAVTDYDEAYYVQPALGMVESGNWVTPYANGVRFLEKPPLLYWVTAASFKTFGINEFSLRFPTACAVVALVLIVACTAGRAGDPAAAMTAGLATAFSAGAYLFTRETLHDVWLVLLLALAVWALLRWRLDPRRPLGPALVFYGAAAGATMCKSLVGVAFPLGIAAVFFLLGRERPRWRTLHLLPGAALYLALAAPWHAMAALDNRGFLEYFFLEEQVLRFLGMRALPVLWSVPLWLFWALVPVWFFPWTAFLPAALRAGRGPGDAPERILVRLAVAWAVVVLGFFSLSARLEHYAFPALPALAVLAGTAMHRGRGGRAVLWGFRGLALFGLLCLAFAILAGAWIAAGGGFDYALPESPDRIAETDFSILAEIPPEMAARLLGPAAAAVLALAAGFVAALGFERRGRRVPAIVCVALTMAAVFGMAHWSLHICEDLISSKKFALAIAREAGPGDRAVVVGDYESANSLNFYVPIGVEVYRGEAYALVPGLRYGDSPKILLSDEEFAEAWRGPGRVFALAPASGVEALVPGGREMLRVLDRVLVCNR